MSRFFNLSVVSPVLVSAVVLVACSHKHAEKHGENDGHGHNHDHQDEIVMSPKDAARFGVKVEAVGRSPFSEIVKVSGEIMPAATERAVIIATTSGVVKLAKGIEIGKNVKAGELIATISAKNLTGGDSNQTSLVTMQAAKRELDRLEPLLKDGLITKKEYNEALRAYEEAKSSYSPTAATGRAVSGMTGVVSVLAVNDGAYVETGQPIATITRNTRLTLKALLPSGDIDFLGKISTANFRPSHSDKIINLADRNGVLLSSSANGGGDTPGYLPVYFSFENYGDVVPGSPAEIYLVGSAKTEALTVPVEAVSEQQGTKFIYIKIDDHGYHKQNVTAGRSDGKRVEITTGLNDGDSVVTSGCTFIRLAETSTVVPEGHSHSH